MPWIMHSEVTRRPWRCRFYIGSIVVADIVYDNRKPWLILHEARCEGPFATVSDAMKRMHELLNNPPPVKEPNDD